MTDPLTYFTDPVLRAPTIGSMLMCLAAALVGVLVLLRRQSLIGEVLSHSAYPGVILGLLTVGLLGFGEALSPLIVLTGAFITASLGLWCIHGLQSSLKIRPDSALCFVLSAFFGVGITLASQIQFAYPALYKQVQIYLYGQAATMTDIHIIVYGILALGVVIALGLFYKEFYLTTFDRDFARSQGLNIQFFDSILYILVVLAVVIGVRSVGVVLMSAMLIAPAVAARQYTHHLGRMFLLAAIFGLLSAFLGVYFSVELSSRRLPFPTGPMIVIIASFICFISLLIAPERGALSRLFRAIRFRYKCLCENVLKQLWRLKGPQGMNFNQIQKYHIVSKPFLWFILHRLARNGWVHVTPDGFYHLTHQGENWAARIVRLHRLWEVYLVEYIGMDTERVHKNAEEMEHIITHEVERELVILLQDPKMDPHDQPIPPEGVL